jgi:hypothetical protein
LIYIFYLVKCHVSRLPYSYPSCVDLLNRTKVQKVILHSLLSGVHTFTSSSSSSFTLNVIRFNDDEGEKDNSSSNAAISGK